MEFDLPATAAYTPYKIIIEGVLGEGTAGDIAIDDISFTPGCQFYN